MNDPTSLLCPLVLIAILILMYFINQKAARDAIEQYLIARGATDIRIKNNFFDSDRGTLTFRVEYTGLNGKAQFTTCKIQTGIFSSKQIYWSNLDELNALPDEPESAIPINHQFSDKIRAQSTIALPTYQVIKALPIQGTMDQIVLLDYTFSFQNLLRCNADGLILWQAALPTPSDDAYTNVAWKDGELAAFSKSLIAVTLDVSTGKIVA